MLVNRSFFRNRPTSSERIAPLAAAIAARYRIERELGAGGMATVYLARDLRHDRDVALKVLRPDLAGALGRDRFVREIKLAARLAHPHIIPLYDSEEVDGFLFFVMPVLQGQTLRERLQQETRLSVESAVRIACEVADALDYAHRNDIVHRDIKPENILLHEGHALVADFGIGKALVAASTTDGRITQVGVTVGTPAYMSPEQAAGEMLDGRSDLFALGCVLYEMLAGECAFTGANAQAVIVRRFVYSPPAVSSTRSDVPESISHVVSRLLATDAADRYECGHHAADALRAVSASVALSKHATPAAADTSIAVLPFANMSADADNEYFSDGLTEEIITDLSRVKALRVTSRTSSMQHKGSTLGLREIGHALGVRYVLTGSVRRAGNALRISAQLVDVVDDRQLWGEKFRGTMDDVFDVQERVAREIVAALGITLQPEEEQRLASRGLVHVAAFELFLEAREQIRRFIVREGTWNVLLDRATAIEGDVPVLRGLRLWGQVALLKLGVGEPSQLEVLERQARSLVAEAEDRPWGYAALGYLSIERGDMCQAIAWFRESIVRDPTDTELRYWLVTSYAFAGLLDLADEAAAEMKASDPLAPLSYLASVLARVFSGEIAQSIETLRQALEMDPHNYAVRWCLGYAYLAEGNLTATLQVIAWMSSEAAGAPYMRQLRALHSVLRGDRAEGLRMVIAQDISRFDAHLTFHVAEVFAMAGEIERGMEVLTLAVHKGFTPVAFIARHCAFIEPLRAHPQFAGVLAEAQERSREVLGGV